MFVEDVAAIPPGELEAELAAQAAHVDAGLCRLLELVAECERRLPLALEGTTFAGWLAFRCSLAPRQAREHVRLAERLGELPLTHAAFARGELSYAKVGVLARVAEPASEQGLLELAEALTAPQLERAVGAYRQVSREEAAAQQQREFLDYQWRDDGSLALRGRLAADDGALVLQALDAGREALWEKRQARPLDAAHPPADGQPPRPSNAEALVALAEFALTNPEGARSGGEGCQIVVHVDAATLASDADGRCELADGQPLAPESARRLACDASLVELLEREGQPLTLGRKRRTVSPALRRALSARDRGCRFPGCNNSRFVDGHHLQHWSHGGQTNLDNLILLCRRHHRLVHEHGYTIELDHGEARFRNRHGTLIPNSPPRPPPTNPTSLHNQHQRRGLTIDADTCKHGHGDPMNLSLAVDALIDTCD